MTEAYISTRCKKILYMIMASDTYVSYHRFQKNSNYQKEAFIMNYAKLMIG